MSVQFSSVALILFKHVEQNRSRLTYESLEDGLTRSTTLIGDDVDMLQCLLAVVVNAMQVSRNHCLYFVHKKWRSTVQSRHRDSKRRGVEAFPRPTDYTIGLRERRKPCRELKVDRPCCPAENQFWHILKLEKCIVVCGNLLV